MKTAKNGQKIALFQKRRFFKYLKSYNKMTTVHSVDTRVINNLSFLT